MCDSHRSYIFDALNRVTQRSYSGETGYTTPTVTYTYGTTAPAIGQLTKVSSSVSATEYTSFDILGRVTGHKQTTDGENYETEYVYNLSGALIEQTYPSGRKVKNVIDNNGYLSMVQSRKSANHGYWNYAKNLTYNAAGAVTSMQLGNNRWESTQFNSRLQPTQIALGVTPRATNLLKLDYSYGTTQNNGNVLSQNITVPDVGQTDGFIATQAYEYDSLNRLKSAEEVIGSQTSWKQIFTFDRYGNRNFDEANTTFAGFEKLCASGTELCAELRKIMNPSVNQSNNRLSSSDDYVFDTSGNTTEDAQGRIFIYDAENKQIEVRDSQQNIIGQYRYDGDGKRIKKIVPATDEVTVFVYNASGQLVAEYSTEISQTPKVSYTTADHLGSPRVLTNKQGEVVSRRDFMPFGEEISAMAETHRTPGDKYGVGDNVRQKFTGYEHDEETGLDFAEARYYYNNHGRFTAVDPLLASGKSANPQTFNRYAYTMNRPLILRDPTGLQAGLEIVIAPRKPAARNSYPVKGASNVEAWKDARSRGPKEHGGTKAGRYEFRIDASFKDAPGTITTDEDGTVRAEITVSTITVTVSDKYTIPEWSNKNDEGIPDSERKEWDDELARLESHEKDHTTVTDKGVKEILVPALESLGPVKGIGVGRGKTPKEAREQAFANAAKNAAEKIDSVVKEATRKIQDMHDEIDK